MILFIALLAEVSRAPFDLPEAEQELTAGYHTEYSGMKFALFYLAEYIGMITVSMVGAALYLGGYHFVLVDRFPLLGPLVYAVKVILLLMGMVWVRATLPRIRYDRLMHFGWKIMLPLAMAAVVWSAVAVLLADEFGRGVTAIFSIAALVLFLAGTQWWLSRAGRGIIDEPSESARVETVSLSEQARGGR